MNSSRAESRNGESDLDADSDDGGIPSQDRPRGSDADDGADAQPPSSSHAPNSEAHGPIAVELFGRTDVGQIREHNEDNFLVADLSSRQRGLGSSSKTMDVGHGGVLMVVCDGMGGAAAGEVASQLAADIVFQHMSDASGHNKRDRLALDIVESLEIAGRRILDESNTNRSFRGMGTTATVAALVDDHLLLGQVGDSRAYILRGDRLVQVTRDQSLVNQLIEAGQLTEEEAENFEHSNIILQALGTAEVVQVDLTYAVLRRGDVLMMCSDGLSGMVRDREMAETLLQVPDPVEACRLLIDDANLAGGHDNITVIVAAFDGEGLTLCEPEHIDELRYQKYALPGWDADTFDDTAHDRTLDPYEHYDDSPLIEITGEFEIDESSVDWDDVLAGRYELLPMENESPSNMLIWVALIGLAIALYLLFN